jgi:flagellar protein FliS
MDRNISKYVTQQVMTASPAMLVYMLLDKAISSLQEATSAIEEGDVERRWRANNRATEIISHLWSTLDRERGGEIAGNLDQLYSFILRRLPSVDLQNDPKPAEDVIGLLEPLRESWKEIARQSSQASRQTANAEAPEGPADDRPRTIVSA